MTKNKRVAINKLFIYRKKNNHTRSINTQVIHKAKFIGLSTELL